MATPILISVVDDDESVRESLPDLLREFGFSARAFHSAESFLASDAPKNTGCLILDVAMPGMTGPDLQQVLAERGIDVSIVFITAQADEALHRKLLARGASACLLKPFNQAVLLRALKHALTAENC